MIHIISKRNDSLNIILLCTLHYPVSFLFIIYSIYLFVRVSKYSKSSCKIIKSAYDWRNSFKNKKYLYSLSFHIQKLFAEMAFRLLNLKIFQTQVISHISSPGDDWLIDLFYAANRLLKKPKTLNFPSSKLSLGYCMLARDPTISPNFLPIE